jgi:cytosine/adenosine deaminase-related metal-dependent hydrolase
VRHILSADWVIPVEGPPVEQGAVAIENRRIAAVGTRGELGEGIHYAEAAIIPGFVNAHTHLEYAVFAGFGDGLPFSPWIALHIERKARIGVPELEAIARLGALECLASGITTVGDASFSGAAATACDELGLRGIVYLEVFGAGTEHISTRFAANRDRIAGSLSDRVRLGVSPHTVFTASLELWEAAASLGVPMMTHFSESEGEVEWVQHRTGPFAPVLKDVGPNSIRLLAERGLLSSRLVAAHGVHLDEEETALLAEHGVAIAHCPRSNALLGCGIAPVAELRAAGVRVGIGTDSPASTPSFDFFDELRSAVYLARARDRRAETLTAAEALELGTLGSARALGLQDDVGSLVPGKLADLAVVSLAGSPYLPWEDPVAAVVFGGSPDRVLTTMVEGAVRYKRGEREWRELRRHAANARKQMLAAGSVAPSRALLSA